MNWELSNARCYEMVRRARWPNGISCPFCGWSRVTTHSKFAETPRRRYLCLGCRRTFTDLTGTPLARTRLPLGAWFLCLRLIGQGRNVVELARDLEVKWDTAARIQRQLATALGRPGLIRQLRETLENAEGDSRKLDVPQESLRSRSGASYGTVIRGKRRWTEGG